jgi:hypothetical protein
MIISCWLVQGFLAYVWTVVHFKVQPAADQKGEKKCIEQDTRLVSVIVDTTALRKTDKGRGSRQFA